MIRLHSFDEGDKIGFAHHENGSPIRGYVERTGEVKNIRCSDRDDLTILEVETDDDTVYQLEQSDVGRGDDSVSVTRVTETPPYENLLATEQVERIEG